MPARGGNPSLSDQDLFDALAMVRELQVAAAVPVPAEGTVTAVAPPKPISDQPQMIDGALWYPHSILAAASVGPRGTSRTAVRLQKPGAVGRSPENVRRFFSFALLVSGLHGIYLAIGIVMGTAVLAHAPSRRSPATLRMVAVYWLVVGGLGLVLLPATYF